MIGWSLWEFPTLFVGAEFHAVWRKPDGSLVGVAPEWAREDAAAPDAPALASALRVVHNDVHLQPPPGYEYDGIAEWWFASATAARAGFGRADLRGGMPRSLGAIADLGQSIFLLTGVTHSRP